MLSLQTFRQSVRALRRNPGFASATILTLAVGIGGTVAVFSVMSAALLKPLPYPNARRLAAISESRKGEEISVSYPNLRDYQAQTRVFESIAAFAGSSFTLTGGADPERLRGQMVTANLFSVLGVHPILGHDFAPTDDDANGARVVAISHSLWTRRFAGDSGVIGRSVVLDGEPFTIVAVMPDGFRFPDGIVYGPSELWTTMSRLGADDRAQRGSHPGLEGIGLLKPGTSLRQGSADLAAVAVRLSKLYPENDGESGIIVRDAIETIVGSLKNGLVLLFGAALLVLLIACANVGGLMLTRADARRREMTIKAALGATGMRVVANFTSEGLIVACLGGVAGTALAFALIRGFGGAVADLPRLANVSVDPIALVFALGVTMAVALACSLVPALWAGGLDTQRWLQARGTTEGRGTRLRHAFVVGQIAMSLVLLVTSTLLLRTFERMSADTGGIRPGHVVTFAVQLPDAQYSNAQRVAFSRTLMERLGAAPGVTHAGAISVLPFSGSGAQSGIVAFGGRREDERRTDVAAVTPDYFHAMGVDVVRGRAFTTADNEQGLPVAVVDEQFAAAVWPGQNPIGQRISGWTRPEWTVVGVVRHVKNYGVSADSRQEMYVPFAQRPTSRLWVAVNSERETAATIAVARAVIKELDPSLPLFSTRAMNDVVDATVSGPRLSAYLSAGYALTALLVVIIGIHGALAYLVHRRTREIGLRMALGAQSRQMLQLVMGHALRLTALGLVLGMIGAVVTARVIRGQLFGIDPIDVPSFAIAIVLMLGVALLAGAFPALRAGRVSPMTALAEE